MRKKVNNAVYVCLIILLLSIVIARIFFISLISVPTRSMSPTIDAGYSLITLKKVNKVERGDILTFYSAELGKDLVKRVVGMPGEIIDIKNGSVYVDGELLQEDYVQNNEEYNGTFYVPDDCYFFLGDNRANSSDARYWEQPYIYESYITGKVVLCFYPVVRVVK